MSLKRFLLGAAFVAFAAGLGGLAVTLGPLAPVEVSIAQAGPADLPVAVFGVGTVEARHAYNVGPTQTGRVAAVRVDHGDRVQAGQVLAEMDPIDLGERRAATEAALARARDAARAARAQAQEAQSRSRLAAANAARARELAAKGFLSREAVESRDGEAEAAKAGLEAARAQAGAAEGDLLRLARERDAFAKQLASLRLRSPVDGLVVERSAEPGSTVVAGQPVVRVVDPSSAWVVTRIDQARAGTVRVGQAAEIVLRSRRGLAPLAGRVARVELQSDAVTEERMVSVAFERLPEGLSLGELAEVTIRGEPIEDALVIPGAALRRVGEHTGVWRIEDGRARFHRVTAGAQSLDGRLELLDGLRRGDEVIVYAAALLSEGDRVRVASSP